MLHYRLYRLHPDNGHINGVEEFEAPDDAAAIARAEARAGSIALELWQEGRKLVHVPAGPEMAARGLAGRGPAGQGREPLFGT